MPAAPVKKTDFPFSTRSITCRCSAQSPSGSRTGIGRRDKSSGEGGECPRPQHTPHHSTSSEKRNSKKAGAHPVYEVCCEHPTLVASAGHAQGHQLPQSRQHNVPKPPVASQSRTAAPPSTNIPRPPCLQTRIHEHNNTITIYVRKAAAKTHRGFGSTPPPPPPPSPLSLQPRLPPGLSPLRLPRRLHRPPDLSFLCHHHRRRCRLLHLLLSPRFGRTAVRASCYKRRCCYCCRDYCCRRMKKTRMMPFRWRRCCCDCCCGRQEYGREHQATDTPVVPAC